MSLVEKAHFTRYMEEMAIYGVSSVPPSRKEELAGGRELIAGNLDYTLRAIPNHPRALYAMGMWQLGLRRASMRDYQEKLLTWRFKTAECYFERAMMFRPEDGMVHMVYGIFLHKTGELQTAEKYYRKAVELMPESAEPHYNIGLLYFDLKEFHLAREHAIKAYEMGYPLRGLKDALVQAGEWSVGRSPQDLEPRSVIDEDSR